MLYDLYVLRTFFAEQFGAMYEHDLRVKYGDETVRKAIKRGLISHHYVPCGKGRKRCVCSITEKGIAQVKNHPALAI